MCLANLSDKKWSVSVVLRFLIAGTLILLLSCDEARFLSTASQRALIFDVEASRHAAAPYLVQNENSSCEPVFATTLERIISGDARSSELLSFVEKSLLEEKRADKLLCTERHSGPTTRETFGLRAITACATLQFTLPGVPALTQRQEAEILNSESGVNALYRMLIDLRNTYSCLKQGRYMPLGAMMMSGSAAGFIREDDDSIIAVLVNLQNRAVTNVKFAVHPELKQAYQHFQLTNLADSTESVRATELYLEQMLPFEAVLYAAKKMNNDKNPNP
ncbi:MAG: hypothetical protein ACRBF0_20845 [Calditrichia bacterium]